MKQILAEGLIDFTESPEENQDSQRLHYHLHDI